MTEYKFCQQCCNNECIVSSILWKTRGATTELREKLQTAQEALYTIEFERLLSLYDDQLLNDWRIEWEEVDCLKRMHLQFKDGHLPDTWHTHSITDLFCTKRCCPPDIYVILQDTELQTVIQEALLLPNVLQSMIQQFLGDCQLLLSSQKDWLHNHNEAYVCKNCATSYILAHPTVNYRVKNLY